jgi:hypothetical protein
LSNCTGKLRAGSFGTAGNVRAWMAAAFAVHYTAGSIYRLLGRVRWKPKRTRPQALNASPTEQVGREWYVPMRTLSNVLGITISVQRLPIECDPGPRPECFL